MDMQSAIAEALRLGKGGEPLGERCGLCAHLRSVTDCGSDHLLCLALRSAFYAWPEFSGDVDYPVPYDGRDSGEAYDHCKLWEGEYGESRRRLAAHVAQYLTDHAEDFPNES